MRRKFTCYRCGKYVEAEMDDDGDATCPACENVIDLEPERKMQNRIASLEAENASLRERLAAYEVGYDPKVKLPRLFEVENEYPQSKFHLCNVLDNDGTSRLLYCQVFRDEHGALQWLEDSDFSLVWVTRWFPLPEAPKEEE